MNARIKKARESREDGFTLIELLIVIVILGILAAIVVFAVGGTRKDSVSASCKTDYKSIELSLEAINTKTGKYPAAQADAVATSTSTNGALLKSWPGGAAATDDYMFTYTRVSDTAYTVEVDGARVDGTPTLNQDSTKANLDAACKGK